ncbi:MAG: polyhydroxyalkanoate depolymerase [Magnetovibrio sp.]|nr:polyhydroxyalkanoate depolymerase [Magnetovibrio sp.]
MLYHFHEMQHLALSPYRAWLNASRAVMKPLQHTPYGRSMTASLEVAERLTRRYGKPEFGIRHVKVNGKPVRIREEVADETQFCNLLHFKKEGVSGQPKVLLVAPLSGHYATLLRGTVEAMLPDHDLYITDWTDARDVPARAGTFHLDDYIELMTWYFQLLGADSHVMAVCQPSVPVLAAVALQSEDIAAGKPGVVPATMTLMGGPVDTRQSPTSVNQFAKDHDLNWFKSHSIHRVPAVYPGVGRRVYPGFLQLQGFLGMNIDRHMNAHVDHYWHLVKGDGDGAGQHRKFYDEYMSVMDLPAEYFLETIEAVFLTHALPKGELQYRGRTVNPAAIKDVALMTVEGELDDISGVGQTSAAHTICPDIPENKRGTIVQKGVGHYGIFNGRKWRGIIQPKIAEFMKTHGGSTSATENKSKKAKKSKP